MAQSGLGFWKIGGTIVLTILFLAVATAIASAATIYVPDDYPAIQAAVDNATASDTIIVRDGTYTENVRVNKQLTIRSENGPANCIVDASGNGSAITLGVDGITLEGFSAINAGSSFTDAGIKVISSSNKITGNTVSSNKGSGIYLRYSRNNTISGNNVSGNWYGIYLEYTCSNNIISGNNVSGNNIGIYLYPHVFFEYSCSNTISGNNVSGNNWSGISLRYSRNNTISGNNVINNDDGISLWRSYSNTISSNNVINNDDGIFLYQTSSNTISGNDVSNNDGGIYLGDSSYDSIYLNNFVDNTFNAESYEGYESSNVWNSPSKITYTYNGNTYTNYLGNYWDDYEGSDPDGDGIGDTPYSINSDIDNYPLRERFENYVGEDTTPPTVTSVSPEDGAPDVAIDTVVTATFSEAMDRSTITKDSFTLAGSAVSGTVTYDSDTYTATFTPDANLEYDHEYTATLSIAITDKAGNPLTEAYTWSFTTESAPAQKTIYVDDDFIDNPELHKWNTIQEGVDDANDGDTIIVYPGTYTENVDVGKSVTIESEGGAEVTIVQAADPYDYVFEVIADHVNISGFRVKGSTAIWQGAGIYLYHVGYCSILNNDVLNNENGISFQGVSDSKINNNNVYSNNWNGIHIRNSHDNTINNNKASSNRVRGIQLWEASDNIIVHNILSNNGDCGISVFASPTNTIANNNILNNAYGIWLEGTIYSNTNGNAIYLNNFIDNDVSATIWNPPLTNTWNSPEKMTYTYNSNVYTNYLGNYWSDYSGNDVDPKDGIGDTPYPIYGDYYSHEGNKPVVDNDNYPLVERFENYVGEDTTPPTVSSVSPEDGAPDVAIDTVITATFSEAMDSSTITKDSFTLASTPGRGWQEIPPIPPTESMVSGTVTYDSDTYTATFTPDANLEYDHEYTATLSTDITDKAGNPLTEAYTWSFTTESAPAPSEQPQLKAPWEGVAKISQGNNAPQYPHYSHYDHGTWDNTYAIDVALKERSGVLAPAEGVVAYVDKDPGGKGGKELAINHTGPTGKKFVTVYLHLSDVLVEEGDFVKQGQVVAKSGDTGVVTGPHLHFHMWRPKGSKPEWAYDSHTMPIERLVMKQVGADSDFREYDARKGDLDNNRIKGKYFESPLRSQPPICAIELRNDGVKIDEIDVLEFFDIYVGASTDDIGIKEVRFSSDDSQDDNPTGEWTEWYDWDTSSGDWDADTKIKRWAFDTGGAKEVWADVKDEAGQTSKCSANIYANPLIPAQSKKSVIF